MDKLHCDKYSSALSARISVRDDRQPHTAAIALCGVIEISCRWHEVVNRKSLVYSEKQVVIEKTTQIT